VIPGRGPDLVVRHTFDSNGALAGAGTVAGRGWLTGTTQSLGGVVTRTVTYTDATGAAWPFVYLGRPTDSPPYSAYATPRGLPWQLTASTTGYTLTTILTSETLTFDAQGRLRADTDAYGNSNTLGYLPGASSPMTLTNSGGRAICLPYYSNGLLSDVDSPLAERSNETQGQVVTYGYDGLRELTRETWGAGTSDAITATYGYSGTQLVTVTTPYTGATRAWSLGYDAQGRVATIASPVSGTVGQAGYTPAYTTTFSYKPGYAQVVRGAGTTAALTATYTLDAQGEPLTIQDGLGHTTRASYDADHDVTTSADANGNVTTNEYQYIGPNGAVGQVVEED